MTKTVRFAFSSPVSSSPTSSTTTTITPSSYNCSSSPTLLNQHCFMSSNNNNNYNNKIEDNKKMHNGNEQLSSTPSTSTTTAITRILPSSTMTPISTGTAIITSTATTNNYHTLYPSVLEENPPTSRSSEDDGSQGGNNGGERNVSGLYTDGITDGGGDSYNNGRDHNENGSQNNLLSSQHTLDYDSMTEVVFDDLHETEPTSIILDFCKRKFLKLYVNLLGLAGLYPASSDSSCIRITLSHLQTVIILTVLCFGYYLQYCSSFRRDRGFSVNSSMIMTTLVLNPYYRDALDFGEIFFVHIIPSALHLFGFVMAVYVFRIADNEQLQNLVERVFLLSNKPKRLCIMLWLHVIGGFIFLTLFTSYVILLVYSQPDSLQLGLFVMPGVQPHYSSKLALIVTTITHDAIQMTVVTAYCIECYLLRLHLRSLKEKLLQHTIETIDWMREVLEFRKLLNHLNKKVAQPICFFTLMNLSYAFAGLIYVFKEYDFNCPIKIFILNLGNVILWLIIGMIPFFQAAAVTHGCQSAQASGHQIRVRPFVYHNMPSSDLDSTLLFASSLNMSAKLFRMPVQANYLCFTILVISIICLTLGMCLNISLGVV